MSGTKNTFWDDETKRICVGNEQSKGTRSVLYVHEYLFLSIVT